MTVATTLVFQDYTADGSTTAFGLAAYCQTADQVEVLIDDVVQSDATYTVSGLRSPTGVTATFSTAPTSGTVRVRRVLPLTQGVDTQNNEVTYQQVFDDALDRGVMVDQQLAEELGRALVRPQGGVDYDADGGRITGLADGEENSDAATYGQLLTVRDFAQAGAITAAAVVASQAVLAASTVPAAMGALLLLGRASAGDGGGCRVKRVLAEPAWGGVRSTDRYLPNGSTDNANGGWWRIDEPIVRPEMFASLSGTTADRTLALRSSLRFVMTYGGEARWPAGAYTVNGTLGATLQATDCSLRLVCEGPVYLTFDAAAAAIDALIYAGSLNPASFEIIGGPLYIDGNNKIARAIDCRHQGGGSYATVGGLLRWKNVHVSNLKAATGISAAFGLFAQGPFEDYDIADCSADTVDRTDASGECKGIAVSEAQRPVKFSRCKAARILIGAGTADADGMAAFGTLSGTTPLLPKATFEDCEFEDCQGRSIKTQCRDTRVIRPAFKRQAVVAIANGHEIDTQYGSLICEQARFEYRKNGATSPLSASFVPIAVQHLYPDNPKVSRVVGGQLLTEGDMPSFAFFFADSDTPDSVFEIDGLKTIPLGSFATTAFTRGLLEFKANEIEAMSKTVRLRVVNTHGPNTGGLITYTGHTGADISAKLSIEAHGNVNTLATAPRLLAKQSGAIIVALDRYVFGQNPGYTARTEAGWNVDFTNGALLPGNDFFVDLATAVFTSGPSGLPATGSARIRAGSQDAASWCAREVIVDDGKARFYTLTGTWSGATYVYTNTNVTADRAFDADTVAVAELADVVGTLISDLKTSGALP